MLPSVNNSCDSVGNNLCSINIPNFINKILWNNSYLYFYFIFYKFLTNGIKSDKKSAETASSKWLINKLVLKKIIPARFCTEFYSWKKYAVFDSIQDHICNQLWDSKFTVSCATIACFIHGFGTSIKTAKSRVHSLNIEIIDIVIWYLPFEKAMIQVE